MVRRVRINIDLPIFFIKQENVLTILKIGTQKPAFNLNIKDKSIMEHIYKISEYHVYLCTVGPYFYVNYICLFKRIDIEMINYSCADYTTEKSFKCQILS